MINREKAKILLQSYIESESLLNHSHMVAQGMEAYAISLGKPKNIIDKWWITGLLHDLDWEKYPDEHPNKAIQDILPEYDIDNDMIDAIASHAPERTGRYPDSELDKYLFACDEISGFMNAVALMRPNRFLDMKVKSVTKKLKDSKFAANVSRDDIKKGADLIGRSLQEHLLFLIEVFRQN